VTFLSASTKGDLCLSRLSLMVNYYAVVVTFSLIVAAVMEWIVAFGQLSAGLIISAGRA
jgi:hypothetical protein